MIAAMTTRMKVMISNALNPPPRSLLIFRRPKFSVLSFSMVSAVSELELLPMLRRKNIWINEEARADWSVGCFRR